MKIKLLAPFIVVLLLLAGCGPPTFKCALGRVYTIKEYREQIGGDIDTLDQYKWNDPYDMQQGARGDLEMMGFKSSETNIKFVQEVYSMEDAQLGVWMTARSK